jgi:hypothetical protein
MPIPSNGTTEQRTSQQTQLVKQTQLPESTNAFIDSLKSEVELLRNQFEGQRELLSRELEDWKEEARRKDAIILSLTQRIPGLEELPESLRQSRENRL